MNNNQVIDKENASFIPGTNIPLPADKNAAATKAQMAAAQQQPGMNNKWQQGGFAAGAPSARQAPTLVSNVGAGGVGVGPSSRKLF